MAVYFNDNINVRAPKPVDDRMLKGDRTTYLNKADVISSIPLRERGLGVITMIGTDLHFFKTGTSTINNIFKILSEADITQTTGNDTNLIMSQDAVTNALYTSWNLQVGGSTKQVVGKNDNVDFVAGSNINITYTSSAVNISSTINSGDYMLKSVYDPNNIAADAFDFDNFINVPTYDEYYYIVQTGDIVNNTVTTTAPHFILLTQIHFVTINGVVILDTAITYGGASVTIDYNQLDFNATVGDRIEVRYYY